MKARRRAISAAYFLAGVFLIASCDVFTPAATPTLFPPSPTLPLPATPMQATATAVQIAPTVTETTQPSTDTPAVVTPTSPLNTPAVGNTQRSVILLPPGQTLAVYQDASAESPVLASLEAQERDITVTGQKETSSNQEWVEITLPGGQAGWVDGFYLTEAVPQSEFCADGRIPRLFTDLAAALEEKDGEKLKSLISPKHGLYMHYYHSGNVVNYSSEEAGWVFKSTYVTNWGTHPASGLEVKGTFTGEVLPNLLDVFQNNYELSCMDITTGGINYEAMWPYAYANIGFYSAVKQGTPGIDLDWRTWVTGIEYVDGTPYIFSLHQFFWEP